MGSEKQKERGRIKRRNMIAKHMLEERRQYGERVIKDKTKQNKQKHKGKLYDYREDEEDFGCSAVHSGECVWPKCNC